MSDLVVETGVMIPRQLRPSGRHVGFTVSRWRKVMRAELVAELLACSATVPAPPVTVDVEYRYCSRLPRGDAEAFARDGNAYRADDADNLASAGNKALMDALVKAGWLPDDNRAIVPRSPTWTPMQVERFEDEGIVIRINEIRGKGGS